MFFFTIKSLLNNTYLSIQSLLIRILTFQLSPSFLILWIFKFLGKLVLLNMYVLYLSLQIKHFFRIFWDLYQSLLCNLYLSLIFSNLNLNHSDLILHIFDVHFSCSEYIFLDVWFLVKNTELIVSINQLDTSEISILASELILLSQSLHILLQRHYYHIEFLDLIRILIHEFFLFFFFELILV